MDKIIPDVIDVEEIIDLDHRLYCMINENEVNWEMEQSSGLGGLTTIIHNMIMRDIGYLDNEGHLFLKGRNDDIVNIGGEKVIPSEIEETLKQIPQIVDVVAFGIDNEIFGKTIKVLIVKKENSELNKTTILSHCLKNLEKFKIPSKIEFVEKIPRNEYGKVKRTMLK